MFIIVFVSFIYGCERNDDSVPEPDVAVVLPGENDVFSVFDTIQVKVAIKHIYDIRKVSLSVTDADLKPVISGKSINTSGTEVTIDTFLVVNNKYIDQTLNYLHIEVEDEQNTFNHWTAINIIPLSRHLEKLVFVSGIEKENNLFMIQNNEERIKVASWNSDYLGGFVDSKFNLFYTSGSVFDGLRCYNLTDHSLIWNVPVQFTGSIPYFISFHALNGRLSVGLWDGSVDSYDHNGMKLFSSAKLPNGRLSQILNLSNHIIGVFTPFNGGVNQLMIYNYPAGNLYHSMLVEGRPIALFPVDKRTVLMLSEVNGVVKAYHYKTEDKTLYFLHDVTSLTVIKASGDSRNIFLVTSEAILLYQPEYIRTEQYLTIDSTGSLAYEPEDNILFVSRGNQIFSYKLPENVPDITYQIDEPVKDILLLYNK